MPSAGITRITGSATIAGFAALAVASLLMTACAHLPGSARARHCPVTPARVDEGVDLRIRQRLRLRPRQGTDEQERRVDTVTERRGDRLVLVGLTPAGTRAFSVVRHGDETDVDRGVARFLGVDPEDVLDAVSRTRLLGWDEPVQPDGEHVTLGSGEDRIDVWRGGRRVARRFREPGQETAAVRIEYRFDPSTPSGAVASRGGPGPNPPPDAIWIENDWCGYEARIATGSEEELP